MDRSATISSLLEKARETYFFSAYQVYASHRDKVEQWAGGQTSYWPGAHAVTEKTLFDIGSVTKAVATVSVLARAVDQGKLRLDHTTGQWVPEWKNSRLGQLVLQDLLGHCAGLVPWADLAALRAKGFRQGILDHEQAWIVSAAGKKTAYSDIGFLILGEVLQEVFQQEWEPLFHDQVVTPLCLKEVQYGPLAKDAEVAATEVRAGVPVQGTVFDENSAALGGKTPHAGLFATARGLAPWCIEWLKAGKGHSSWLSSSTAQQFTRRQNRVAGSSWALGWDTKSAEGSSAGALFSSASFGHLGYPGCSVWLDPERESFLIFWSNRVHPSRLDERIRKFRPLLHDAVASGWT